MTGVQTCALPISFDFAYKHNKNIRLDLIGDGIEREKIESFIEKRNLKQVIKLIGWKNDISRYVIN